MRRRWPAGWLFVPFRSRHLNAVKAVRLSVCQQSNAYFPKPVDTSFKVICSQGQRQSSRTVPGMLQQTNDDPSHRTRQFQLYFLISSNNNVHPGTGSIHPAAILLRVTVAHFCAYHRRHLAPQPYISIQTRISYNNHHSTPAALATELPAAAGRGAPPVLCTLWQPPPPRAAACAAAACRCTGRTVPSR